MSNQARIQLVKWLLIIGVIITGALFWKFERQSYIVSTQGELQSNAYTVGIDYTGVILNVLVKTGDTVTKDQPLVVLKSSTLIERLNEAKVSKEDLIYDLTSENDIILKAQSDGIVNDIFFTQGSFVPANSEILTVVDNEYFIQAEFTVPESDFYLITQDTPAVMSIGNDRYKGTLQDFNVIKSENSLIYIEAKISPNNPNELQKYRIGSPMSTRLLIKDNPFRTLLP